jgi:hypothetical protein
MGIGAAFFLSFAGEGEGCFFVGIGSCRIQELQDFRSCGI